METISPKYLVQLCNTLVDRFNEEELSSLCITLGVDYENLKGGKVGKVQELILYLGRRERISEFVEICKLLRPKANWEDASKRKRYYIASDREGREAFNLDDSSGDFERTSDYSIADFIVLDLYRPPQDWFKYVKGKPRTSVILFAEKLPEASPVELDGKSILSILERACGFPLRVWMPQEGLLNALRGARNEQMETTEEERVLQRRYNDVILAAVR